MISIPTINGGSPAALYYDHARWRASLPVSTHYTPGALERKNPHPWDQYVAFDEEPHVYSIYQVQQNISVTTLIKKCFPHFDADAVIPGLMRKAEGKYVGMSADAIKESWAANGKRASSLGTKMHAAIERFYNGVPLPAIVTEGKDLPSFLAKPVVITSGIAIPTLSSSVVESKAPHREEEMDPDNIIPLQHFLKFHHEVAKGWIPYRTEWRIFDPAYGIVGTIDYVAIPDPSRPDEVIICDWKRSKKIHTNAFKDKNGKVKMGCVPATEGMEACNWNEYVIQLNEYKWLMQRNYRKKVVKMYIIVFHPDYASYQLLPVPDRQDVIEALMAWHLATKMK